MSGPKMRVERTDRMTVFRRDLRQAFVQQCAGTSDPAVKAWRFHVLGDDEWCDPGYRTRGEAERAALAALSQPRPAMDPAAREACIERFDECLEQLRRVFSDELQDDMSISFEVRIERARVTAYGYGGHHEACQLYGPEEQNT